MRFPLPKPVIYILETLEKAGFSAYCVGGCVRDLLLFKSPFDYDITTSAKPDQIKALFENTVDTGLKHGTVTVIIEHTPYEVTTFRADGEYKDHRKPNTVDFVDNINEDLSRRDFTINAMAYNMPDGLVDIFSGENDIKEKILRAVGEPKKRFNEDALRILRLFRFSSTLNFSIEQNTLSAAIECANELESISRERIASELFKILLSDYPNNSLPLFNNGSLKFLGINKANFCNFSSLPSERFIRFAAFCKNSGCDSVKLCEELKLDNELKRYCNNITGVFNNLPNSCAEIKTSMRDFSEKATEDALLLCGKDFSKVNEIITSSEPYLISHLKVNGEDLLKLGLSGTEIGKTLKELSNAVINNPSLNNKDALLSILKN